MMQTKGGQVEWRGAIKVRTSGIDIGMPLLDKHTCHISTAEERGHMQRCHVRPLGARIHLSALVKQPLFGP